MPNTLNADNARWFRPGAQLAAELLTGTLLMDEFNAVTYLSDAVNGRADHQDAIGVLMLALVCSVDNHARLLRDQPPAGGVELYLRREGELLAKTLAFLDAPIPPVDYGAEGEADDET